MRLLILLYLFGCPVLLLAQHPVTFFTKAEAIQVKAGIGKYPLVKQSYEELKKDTDPYLGKDVDVPFPKDPAGGYTHDRHKANYTLLFNCGILYNLTGDNRYAALAKNIFLKYAALNPTLPKHPQATSNSPGHIFWQALNDANWLVYAGMGYDLIYNSLTASERKTIEEGAFKPEVDYITKDLQPWFDLVHNHGVWACAGVGIVGIATGNKDYVDMALYGTKKDGKSGFITQLDGLFSPDGYYTEGPYYVRYAILPYYIFANALQHSRPALKVFEHRNKILQKALLAALQQTNIDGAFFPFNDAIREKDYTSNEIVTAIDIAWDVYGNDPGLLAVARKQSKVLLLKGGNAIAAALAADKTASSFYPYRSVEYADGVNGKEGGISLLRNGKDNNLSTLIFKYTSHGLSHGHFDKLNYSFYDKGNEIITDYGSVRFVGVEQKYGGRYLRENDAYAAQTIAHNTIVADETSHFNGSEKESEKFHPEKLFSDIGKKNVQVVCARDENAYKGIGMQRSVYMLQLPDGKKIVADLFHVASADIHQYDLPFHYNGQLISTSVKYTAATKSQEPLGKKNGYQFLWKEAVAEVKDTLVQLTFLNERTYYSVSSLATGDATVLFGRTGANDPDFNLRREPVFILRKKAGNQSFLSVIEIHGNMDPVNEFSTQSYSSIQQLRWIQNDAQYSLAEINVAGKKLVIAQANKQTATAAMHTTNSFSWTGPYAVWFDGKKLD